MPTTQQATATVEPDRSWIAPRRPVRTYTQDGELRYADTGRRVDERLGSHVVIWIVDDPQAWAAAIEAEGDAQVGQWPKASRATGEYRRDQAYESAARIRADGPCRWVRSHHHTQADADASAAELRRSHPNPGVRYEVAAITAAGACPTCHQPHIHASGQWWHHLGRYPVDCPNQPQPDDGAEAGDLVQADAVPVVAGDLATIEWRLDTYAGLWLPTEDLAAVTAWMAANGMDRATAERPVVVEDGRITFGQDRSPSDVPPPDRDIVTVTVPVRTPPPMVWQPTCTPQVLAELADLFGQHTWSSAFDGVCVECSRRHSGDPEQTWWRRDEVVPWPCASVWDALYEAGMPVPPQPTRHGPRVLGNLLDPRDNAKAFGRPR